jgi:thiol-disulfide isomerase/thioredoxin
MINCRSAIIAIAIMLFAASAAGAYPDLFSHYPLLVSAQSDAQKRGKLVVVDFMASWCGPCKRMDETTWIDPKVKKWIADNAIAVQLDVDQDQTTSMLLNVQAMPTIVVFGAKNPYKEAARRTGYQTSDELLPWLEALKNQKSIDASPGGNATAPRGMTMTDLMMTIGFALACLVAVIVLAKIASTRFAELSQKKSEEDWVKEPTRACPENNLIEGNWTGSYDYKDKGLLPGDHAFAATFTGVGVFSGHIMDSLGESIVVGAINYPNVRFKKKNAQPAPASKSTNVASTIFYQGKFAADGSLSGEWFVSPTNRNLLRGTWKMNRSAIASTAQDNDATTLPEHD